MVPDDSDSAFGPGFPDRGAEITDIQRELSATGRSRARRYADLVVGRRGFRALLRHEAIVTLSSAVPGALGLWLRTKLYPLLLGGCGRNVTFGVNVTLRHPHKITIGDDVTVDDGCCLDAKGTSNRGIDIGDGVFIGRQTILSCKNGDILIGERANLGFHCEIFSGRRVRVGRNVLIAAYTYLVGGDHRHGRTDLPVMLQGRSARGIDIEDNVWLGAHVVVADGVTVGRDAIVGAGAVVNDDVPAYHVAVGTPARAVRDRRA